MSRTTKGILCLLAVLVISMFFAYRTNLNPQRNGNLIPMSQSQEFINSSSISLGDNLDIEKYQDFVAGGSGSVDDPYIFENLWIENSSIGPSNEISWNDKRIGLSGYGIHVFGNFNKKILIRNCVIQGFQYGIYLDHQYNAQIYNNTIQANYNIGILLESSSYCKVSNNTVDRNRAVGILLYNGANYNLLTNNTCSSTGKGFDFQGTSGGLSPSWAGHGMYLWNDCHYNTIRRNLFCCNGQNGFKIGGSLSTNNLMIDNTFRHNTYAYSYYEGQLAFIDDHNVFKNNLIDPPYVWSEDINLLLGYIGFLLIIKIWLRKDISKLPFKPKNFKILWWINEILIAIVIMTTVMEVFYYTNWGIANFIISVLYILITYLLFFFADTSKNDKINPKLTVFISIVNILHLYNTFIYHSGGTLDSTPILTTKFLIEFTVYTTACFYNFVIIYRIKKKLKSRLRVQTFILSFVGILIGIILPMYILVIMEPSPLYWAALYEYPYLNIIDPNFILLTAWSIEMIIFAQHPELTYILQSNPSRLIVLETERGTPVYSYIWEENEPNFNKALFSGMIQGIRLFVAETMKGGSLQELKLDNSVLLLKQILNYPLVVIVSAEQPTILLHELINSFTASFIAQFKNELDDITDIRRFKKMDAAIERLFPYGSKKN